MSAHLARARWPVVAFVGAFFCMASLTVYAQGFSVSGTVTLTAGHTLPSNRPNACVTVSLTRFSGQIPGVTTTINTDASGNGTYSFSGLPAGDFTVSAYAYELTTPSACTLFPAAAATSTVYTIKFYDGTADSHAGPPDSGAANYFTVGPANQNQTVNFNLVDTTNGSISGRVTRFSNGTGISGASVTAYVYPRVNNVQSVTTNLTGGFTIPGLPPGQYGISATANGFAVKYHNNAVSRATLTPVTVNAGPPTPNVDVALDAPNGSISGVVQDGSNAPVSNVWVAAFDKTSAGFVRSGCPDAATGAYTINRLAPGTYRLRAFHAEAGFVNQYYGAGAAEADFDSGADVMVTANGTISDQNITMAPNPGQILGTITEADSGAPIMGASISIRTPNNNNNAGGDTSHTDGSFLVRGLAPGVYRVRVTHPDFGARWFTFTGGGVSFTDGALVPVVANNSIGDINVALDPNPGSITGKVTTDGTTPLVGQNIAVLSASTLSGVTGATSREDGTYEVLGLDPGTYIVRTNMQYNDQAPTSPPGHAVLFYNNKGSRETADAVTVAAATVTPNIDFIPSPTFGSLSGRVTKTDGTTGIALAQLLAYDATTGNRVWTSETDSTGAFAISQLPPGNYKVRASAHGYAARYFLAGTPGTPTLDLGTPLTVTATKNTPDVNIRLPIPATSAGVYRDGTWYLDLNGNGAWDTCATDACFAWGNPGDKVVLGDWNGDGRTKIGVYRNGTWYLDYNGNGVWDTCATDKCISWGGDPTDIPVVGDWSGSGTTKIGVYRNGTWYLDANGNGTWDTCETDKCMSWGGDPADIPVVGDWNGIGTTKIGVYRTSNGTWYLDTNGDGAWNGCGVDACISWGNPADIPVVGDWNASGTTKIGVYRTSNGTWYLDTNGNGTWNGCGNDTCINWGGDPADIPVVGDWNVSGTTKIAVYRASTGTWYLDTNGNGTWDGCGSDGCISWGGNSADQPIVGKW